MSEKGPKYNNIPDLNQALKIVRSLYWQDRIWRSTGGKKAKEVLPNTLSEEDRNAISLLQKYGGVKAPKEIKDFIERISNRGV